jgi:hypothetical protein
LRGSITKTDWSAGICLQSLNYVIIDDRTNGKFN